LVSTWLEPKVFHKNADVQAFYLEINLKAPNIWLRFSGTK